MNVNEINLNHRAYDDPEVIREVLDSGDREQVIEWLCWNDRIGAYTDEDSEHYGLEPLDFETAAELMRSQVEDV